MNVLVMNDDPFTCKMIQFLLSEEGCSVTCADHFQGARAVLRERDPDLVILDLAVADGSGLEFLREMRQHQFDMPVIFVTANGDPSAKVLSLESGADDYIVKPFYPQELIARTQAVLRRYRRHQWLHNKMSNGVLKVNGIELVVNEMRVQVEPDRSAFLTPTEMKMLHCLMVNAGRVLSRQSLIDAIWDYGSETESNQIDVYIRRLRQKIEGNPSRPRRIETVRGSGYRFRSS